MREMDGLILRNDGGTAYNKAYLATCLRHFAQILLSRSSDTLVTLGETAIRKVKNDSKRNRKAFRRTNNEG